MRPDQLLVTVFPAVRQTPGVATTVTTAATSVGPAPAPPPWSASTIVTSARTTPPPTPPAPPGHQEPPESPEIMGALGASAALQHQETCRRNALGSWQQICVHLVLTASKSRTSSFPSVSLTVSPGVPDSW